MGQSLETAMIEINIKAKKFGDNCILQDVNFHVHKHERVAILGPSGVGKTTLLRMICGLDMNYDGQIYTDGSIAMMFQEPTLMPWRTAVENLTLATNVDAGTAVKILGELGLSDHCHHYPNQMSLGQMRRVSLARALCADPEYLIMDEPFASLDQDTATEIANLLNETLTVRKIGLILVTHSQSEASFLTHRRIELGGHPATVVAG
jgi:NitT/TauT family transport system ATP-binding protein